MSRKKEVVTQLPGPRTDPSAGFAPISLPPENWDAILGQFEPIGVHEFEVINPWQKPNPVERKKLDLSTLGTKYSPTVKVLKQEIKRAKLTLPKDISLKKDIEDFILDNAEAFR